MGAFSYCQHKDCDRPLAPATLDEVIEGEQTCNRGHANSPNRSRDDLLLEMAERIALLERKVAALESV